MSPETQNNPPDFADFFSTDGMKNMIALAEKEAKAAKKKALRVLIPAVIGVSLLLIGLGIVIGKYLL